MNTVKKNNSLLVMFRITLFVSLALAFAIFRFESITGHSGSGFIAQAKELPGGVSRVRMLNQIGKELGRAANRLSQIGGRELSLHVLSVHSRIPQNILMSRSEGLKELAPATIVASLTNRSLDDVLAAMSAGSFAGDLIAASKVEVRRAENLFIAALRGMNSNSRAASKGLSDTDSDGIPNLMDDDSDNDGIKNSSDDDVDDDSIDNSSDDDVDGDGIDNSSDDDVDGDGVSNSSDDDIDGDGDDNSVDKDDDGDSSNDDSDDDDDSDGTSDDSDDDHGGHGNDDGDDTGDDHGGNGNDDGDDTGDDNGGNGNDDGDDTGDDHGND
jgi:hypothetical protein